MDTFGLIGLKRNRNVARLLANLLGANGAMIVDTDGNGRVDGFSAAQSNCTPVFALNGGMPGQKITLAAVTNANAEAYVYLTTRIAVSPDTAYALSVDAALVRSTAETVAIQMNWYTAADVEISVSTLAGLNPGTTYIRQSLTATSPATAAKARVVFLIKASAIGDTGYAWFKDALFQAV